MAASTTKAQQTGNLNKACKNILWIWTCVYKLYHCKTFIEVQVSICFTGFMEFVSGNLRTISYFDFQTLRKATKNFHRTNLLGSGGFGPVYQVQVLNQNLMALALIDQLIILSGS